MAPIIWFTVGLALWHFTVFVPYHEYRFWGGIVGSLLVSCAGAMITGAVWMALSGHSVGDTDLLTALAAVPGALAALAVSYWLSLDAEIPD